MAGNAFRTEKWVAGDDSLGWMNSLTKELLPLEDPGCPRLDVDGQVFTRYPCVARVAPGQGFDFYLRLTNSGTNPATEVRLVDVFPAPGDTRCVRRRASAAPSGSRRPPCSGRSCLAGTGELAGSYTTAAPPVCTDDLNRPAVRLRRRGLGSADYDPAATAFRAFVTFPATDLLGPGASSALRFRMAAPPAPTNPEQNEIAWNSFAHTDFFLDNGSHRAAAANRADQDRGGPGLRRAEHHQGSRR